MKINELHQEWFAYKGQRVKPSSLASYETAYATYIAPYFQGWDILLNRTDDVLGFSEIIPDDTGTMRIEGLPTTATRRLNTESHVFIPEPTASNPRKPVRPKQLTLF